MASELSPPRWPDGAKAAISFTMDNLGEAQDVNKGTWRGPVGTHPSVREQLPRMLELLGQHGVRATYFAEAWSLAVYPDAVAELRRRGHEVAWHGYQHETWSSLSAADEAGSFERSFAAAAAAGIDAYEGFRPPGGTVPDAGRTYALLARHGVRYASPLADDDKGRFGVLEGLDGVVVLPFEWRAVDAFYYMDKFAGIRRAHGAPETVLPPAEFRAFLLAKIDGVVRDNSFMSILFHPFLQTSEEKLALMDEVLARIRADPDIWCAPCNKVARWVAEHPELFSPEKL
ncbi:hypothetical protein B0T26DRAFT_873044 [Lasiosphaeria miniovina]|uniref:NodB homology domain-containing protein n=1 Tax=Lasiosphaeria miniovina TaxID=1954250 RepID=A0AA40AB88_9PEZI|nr:uncharacterized protein B0T26DRAFT_873044 [Lasiosphaeria miniovina]KAK0712694.1 hypothetical protein B0T26DRAFT_873044 [Lasiosphaeria miniovina]